MTTYRRSINCLRAAAALFVVFYHYYLNSSYPWQETIPIFRLGFIGVDFFFLLSGLIIAHVYLEQFQSLNPAIYWRFLSRRIARVFPVHAVVLLCMLLLPLVFYGTPDEGPLMRYGFASWLQQLSMFRLWTNPASLTWNTPAWSVSAEMFAYILLFPLFPLILRGDRKLFSAVFLFTAGVLGVTVLAENWGTLNRVRFGRGLLRVTLEFAAGVGLYGILSWWKPNSSCWNWLAIIGFAFFAALTVTSGITLYLLEPFLLEIFLFLSLIAIVAGVYNSSGWLATILSSAPLFYLGKISYSIYIAHIPIFRGLREITELIFGPGHDGVIFCLIVTLLVIVVAALLHKMVEVPARRALRRNFDHLGSFLFVKA